jgi:hypothetical protein
MDQINYLLSFILTRWFAIYLLQSGEFCFILCKKNCDSPSRNVKIPSITCLSGQLNIKSSFLMTWHAYVDFLKFLLPLQLNKKIKIYIFLKKNLKKINYFCIKNCILFFCSGYFLFSIFQ